MSATKIVKPKAGIQDGIGDASNKWEEGHFKALNADTLAVATWLGKAGGQTIYGGTAANEDLTFQGTSNATKTTSYIILQPSGGAVLIGEVASTSNDPALVVGRSITGSGNGHAFVDETTINKSGVIGYNSFDCFSEIVGAQNYDHIAGFQSRPNYQSTGTINRLTSFQSLPTHAAAAGIAARVTHFEARDVAGGGPATAQYGLYIEDLTGATDNHGVHFLGKPNAGSLSSKSGIEILVISGAGHTKFQRTGGAAFPTNRYNTIRSTNPNTTDGNHTGISFTSFDLVGAEKSGAEIGCVFTSHTGGALSGDCVILTRTAGDADASEKLRVTSDGDVGVGTDTPGARLHAVDNRGFGVSGLAGSFERSAGSGFGNAVQLLNPSTVNDNYIGISFATEADGGSIINGAVIGSIFRSHAAGAVTGDLVIYTTLAGVEAEKLRVTAEGDVGIGTDTPAGKLDVDGGIISRAGIIYANTVKWVSGAGDPDGVLAAAVGSLYSRTDGGTGTAFYVKETGAATSSGWVAK